VIKLLISDDSALMRKLLEDLFLKEGDFDIRLARNGNEALELVRSFDPNVVTLDVQMPAWMPDLSGPDHDRGAAPVGDDLFADRGRRRGYLEAIELGAVDFVAKPSARFRWRLTGWVRCWWKRYVPRPRLGSGARCD